MCCRQRCVKLKGVCTKPWSKSVEKNSPSKNIRMQSVGGSRSDESCFHFERCKDRSVGVNSVSYSLKYPISSLKASVHAFLWWPQESINFLKQSSFSCSTSSCFTENAVTALSSSKVSSLINACKSLETWFSRPQKGFLYASSLSRQTSARSWLGLKNDDMIGEKKNWKDRIFGLKQQ